MGTENFNRSLKHTEISS